MSDDLGTGLSVVVTPAPSFAGSWFGSWLNRRSARELDRWRRREETMRLLRWASELAVEDDEYRAEVGVVAIQSLTSSEMLQPEDLDMVARVGKTVLTRRRSRYRDFIAALDSGTGDTGDPDVDGGAHGSNDEGHQSRG